MDSGKSTKTISVLAPSPRSITARSLVRENSDSASDLLISQFGRSMDTLAVSSIHKLDYEVDDDKMDICCEFRVLAGNVGTT